MKKLIISLLTATLMLSIMAVPAVATSTDYVQELADAAIEIGKQQGLSGDELQTFIQNYIKDNMPQEILEQEHNQNDSVSYEDRLKLYNEMKERITIIYRDSILGFKYGSISYHADADEWLKQLSELAALGVSVNDLEEPKTHFTFQWVTDCTLDGYVLAKDFDGQCGVFSLDKKDFVIKFDEKYDLSCGEEYSPFTPNYDGAKYLLSFHIKTTYDLSDKETLRIMEEFPYLLAKDNTTGKYGYLNWHTGEVAIPFIYDAATPFGDGLAAVKKGGYWGYIDADNNVKIDFKYAYAYPFNNGIAQAEGKLIDKNGIILVSSSCTGPCKLYACGTNYYLSKIQMINITTGIIKGIYTVYNRNGEKISEKTFIGNTQNDGVTELTYTNEGIISGKYNGEYFKLETIAFGESQTTTANPTASKVIVDGKTVSFDAYNINSNNYFKLRDIAQIIRGTDKQFNVTWDGSKNAINLISNTAYKTVGGELKAGDGKVKNATLSTSTIYKDGVAVTLTAYNINGNHYFKLRDLGETFNFDVSWDGVNNTVVVDTSKG
ncbi:MAG: WG repeat-containing protein, partial [Anaerovorax sp.]|nr:WG repeat-containing protein [Anaerovorax sp.]